MALDAKTDCPPEVRRKLPPSKMAAATEMSRQAGGLERLCPHPRWRLRGRCPGSAPCRGPASPSSLPPPPRSTQSGLRCTREESGLQALDMAAAAATAATKGNGGGSGRAGAGDSSGARKKKGPGPVATAYLVIYNVVMTAG